ncbi:MAG: hypothetical protein RMK29_05200 [Myxococcales bacterium]|nr:hypothetical protein [Myxococcota bacterium]MDW8281087.1 hypothetical protein [Myxococcales bacterium]
MRLRGLSPWRAGLLACGPLLIGLSACAGPTASRMGTPALPAVDPVVKEAPAAHGTWVDAPVGGLDWVEAGDAPAGPPATPPGRRQEPEAEWQYGEVPWASRLPPAAAAPPPPPPAEKPLSMPEATPVERSLQTIEEAPSQPSVPLRALQGRPPGGARVAGRTEAPRRWALWLGLSLGGGLLLAGGAALTAVLLSRPAEPTLLPLESLR